MPEAPLSPTLEARLGADRELRSAVDELVRVMAKLEDVTIASGDLRKRAPQLHARLTANDARLLDALRELGLFEVADTTEPDGTAGWTLTPAHSALFERLTERHVQQKWRQRLVIGLVVLAACVGFMAAASALLDEQTADERSGVFAQRRSAAAQIGALELPPGERQRLQTAWDHALDTLESRVVDAAQLTKDVMFRICAAMVALVLALPLVGFAASHCAERWDKREPSVRYQDLVEAKAVERRLDRIFTPLVLFVVAAAIVEFATRQLGVVLFSLLLLIQAVLVFGSLPATVWLAYRRAAAGSGLVKQATFAPESRSRTRQQIAGVAVLVTVFMAAVLTLFGRSPAALFLEDPLAGLQARLVAQTAEVDWAVLESHRLRAPVDAVAFRSELEKPWADLVNSLQQPMVRPHHPLGIFLLSVGAAQLLVAAVTAFTYDRAARRAWAAWERRPPEAR